MLQVQMIIFMLSVIATALSTTPANLPIKEHINIGKMRPQCSEFIKIPKNGSLYGSLFPILSPDELKRDCWNLEAFRNCVQPITREDIQEEMMDSFILLKFLTRICYENKEIYLNNSQCIGSYNETTEMQSCFKEILPDHMCSIVNERIDCIGRVVANCGPDAVRLTKLLMRTIFETVWDYYYISCPMTTVLPSKNGSSQMSSLLLKVLPASLLMWIGFH